MTTVANLEAMSDKLKVMRMSAGGSEIRKWNLSMSNTSDSCEHPGVWLAGW
jgi:hypothetical protein